MMAAIPGIHFSANVCSPPWAVTLSLATSWAAAMSFGAVTGLRVYLFAFCSLSGRATQYAPQPSTVIFFGCACTVSHRHLNNVDALNVSNASAKVEPAAEAVTTMAV